MGCSLSSSETVAVDAAQSESSETAANTIEKAPENSSGRYTSIDALEAFVMSGDIQLIKASHVLTAAANVNPLHSRFAKRQDLPDSAKPDAHMLQLKFQEMRAFEERVQRMKGHPHYHWARMQMRFPPLVIVSYAWLAQQHPDADARQLREVLAPALEWYMSERAGLISKECHDFTRCGSTDMRIAAPFTPDGCDFLLFIDYCSLWQKPRTPEQDLAFDRALRGMDLIYAHQQTAVLRLTRLLDGYACKPYCERGWPFFETSVSQFIKPGTCNLDLGGEDTRQALERFRGQLRTPRALAEQARYQCTTANEMLEAMRRGRAPPIVPSHFAEEVETKAITNGKDLDVLIELQAKVAMEVLANGEQMIFPNMGCGGRRSSQRSRPRSACAAPNCGISISSTTS